MRIDRRLWLTADKTDLVEDGDPRAAFLWAIEGRDVPDAEAERLGYAPNDATADPGPVVEEETETVTFGGASDDDLDVMTLATETNIAKVNEFLDRNADDVIEDAPHLIDFDRALAIELEEAGKARVTVLRALRDGES